MTSRLALAFTFLATGIIFLLLDFSTRTPRHHLPTIEYVALLGATVLAILVALLALSRPGALLASLGLVVAAIFWLVIAFATIYLANGSATNWGIRLTHVDALLLALGTLTTAGTSGLAAHSEEARKLIVIQLAVDVPATIALFGLLAGRLVDPARRWLPHQRTPIADAPIGEDD